MTKQRRTFPTAFKRDAAGLVLDQGYTIADAVKSLGVGESALRRWAEQLEQERGGVTPKAKALTPEPQRIQKLKARVNRLEREKVILKSYRTLNLRRVRTYMLIDRLREHEAPEVACEVSDLPASQPLLRT